MSTNATADAIAAIAKGISGMAGASARDPDTLPQTPWTVVSPHQGQIVPGSWEQLLMKFPMRCYVARIGSGAAVEAKVNDLLDAFLAAFRTGIELGGQVSQCVISAWDCNRDYTVAGESYRAIDFVLDVYIARAALYTA